MSTANTAETIATISANALKLAAEAKVKLARAPKAASAAELEKVASVLVATGWIEPGLKEAAIKHLADPVSALQTLETLAQKAAAAVGRQDPRLNNGEPIPTPTKEAGEAQDETEKSAADRQWYARMAQYRKA